LQARITGKSPVALARRRCLAAQAAGPPRKEVEEPFATGEIPVFPLPCPRIAAIFGTGSSSLHGHR
jgi:hypothetical protein